jgi:hypothetical protein
MPGVIEMPGRAQPETMKAIADSWRRRRREGGRGLPGVLQEGATWKPTGVTNEQAQFLATRQFTAAEIAGQMFLVDPSDLGIGVTGTALVYGNLTERNTRRVQVTLMPWIVRLEAALSGLMAQPRYVKFNINALLRGDLKTRYESYQIGIGAGFVEVNEARDWEELPPLEVQDAPDTEVMAEDARMADSEFFDMRAVMAVMAEQSTRTSDTHIHLPDSLQVEMRQEPIVIPAPVVNVPPAQVTVNVEPTPVTVNVPPAEVTVNVPPSEVTVNVPPPAKPLVESVEFERDSSGKITGAKKRTI